MSMQSNGGVPEDHRFKYSHTRKDIEGNEIINHDIGEHQSLPYTESIGKVKQQSIASIKEQNYSSKLHSNDKYIKQDKHQKIMRLSSAT